jgi:hypothetical protein
VTTSKTIDTAKAPEEVAQETETRVVTPVALEIETSQIKWKVLNNSTSTQTKLKF